MFNSLLWILTLVVTLSAATFTFYRYGKNAMVAWITMALIGANIQAGKQITLFGLDIAMGNIMYCLIYYVGDVVTELYGKKEAHRIINLSVATLLFFMGSLYVTTLFVPNEHDGGISQNLADVFGLRGAAPMFAVVGVSVYALTQNLDVVFYHAIMKRTGDGFRYLWLRNNGSTVASQLLDSFLFSALAFTMVPSFWSIEGFDPLPWSVTLTIAVVMYLVKVIIALCDTPFIYLAKRLGSR